MLCSKAHAWTAHIPSEAIDATKESWKVMSDNARKTNECGNEDSLMLNASLVKKYTEVENKRQIDHHHVANEYPLYRKSSCTISF